MRKILLRLAYDGSNYCGWQIQTNGSPKPTLQQVLEQALEVLCKENIRVIASGRTDSGVHAEDQPVMFRTASSVPTDRFKRALNGLLPNDIWVLDAREVDEDFHTIANAKKKTYRYMIHNAPDRDVFLNGRCLEYSRKLDLEAMKQAANLLVGKHDFRAFCSSGSSATTFTRTIYRMEISKVGDMVYVEVEGNGFLYNMVRIIVGTLLAVSEGRVRKEQIQEALISGDRSLLGETAPPQGLYLHKVDYRE
ncbi:tRNA pseudouridine(38-40) synthase TruA [Clostridia bacterium]|nr:tRNA pseudouridine(38-40) synthase TruA [Clostridia bacterium]